MGSCFVLSSYNSLASLTTRRLTDPSFGKDAAAVEWNEAFGIEFRSNWPEVKSFSMKLFHSFLEALEVFHLFKTGYRTSHLVLGR
jgi:hypothetical protein